MKTYIRVAAASLALASAVGCNNDFLSGGELSTDPNRPPVATSRQLFVAVQTATWAQYGSDLSRITGMFVQQSAGVGSQYIPIYNYGINEGTTNGQHYAFYISGGLVDVRKLQTQVAAVNDFRFLGIAQILEAMQMSLAADIFGDIVYSQALKGENPPLDKQSAVYAALLQKLDSGITNVNRVATTNVGPGTADLNYGGDPAKWTRLAHTLKARIYLHQTETNPALYANVLAEAQQGINSPADDYTARYSGAPGENNLLYQFTQEQRPGYIAPDPFAINLISSRSDPRTSRYFNSTLDDYSDEFVGPAQPQVIVSYAENQLMIAEAAYRLGGAGNILIAQNALVAARTAAGFSTTPVPGNPQASANYNGAVPTGPALLREILTEKYIALYMQPEAYNDYKRTCFPNITPVVAGQKIPGRLKYDTNERQTNTNIPTATAQPTRNENDPPNATDPFGAPCLGQ